MKFRQIRNVNKKSEFEICTKKFLSQNKKRAFSNKMTTSPTQPDRSESASPARNDRIEDEIDLNNPSDDDEEDVPTDEDSVGSLVDFIVNGSVDESDVEESEEEEEVEYSDTSDDEEGEESYDPACDSDGSYQPPCQVEVPSDKPLRRSTRRRRVRQVYVPEASDPEDDSE